MAPHIPISYGTPDGTFEGFLGGHILISYFRAPILISKPVVLKVFVAEIKLYGSLENNREGLWGLEQSHSPLDNNSSFKKIVT